mmetsp:Transcript_50697/g.75796  ORF Transcript_50697/g.75796 Transcript_50697/m.75796 type:complete len:95 (-) Transcript_50697:9-293(-)
MSATAPSWPCKTASHLLGPLAICISPGFDTEVVLLIACNAVDLLNLSSLRKGLGRLSKHTRWLNTKTTSGDDSRGKRRFLLKNLVQSSSASLVY